MSKPKILAFAGSLRTGSFNKKLAHAGARMAREAGADVTTIDLRDFPLPIYDEDVENASGLPENAKALKKLFLDHHGLLIAAPEYNGSMSAVFKNTIDWLTRPMGYDGKPEVPYACFLNKVCGLYAASPGALGGLRGLAHVRALLSHVQVLVIPQQFALAKAHEAFDAEGEIKDPKQRDFAKSVAVALVESCRKFHA